MRIIDADILSYALFQKHDAHPYYWDVETKEVSAEPLFFGGKVVTQLVLEEKHKVKKIQVVNVKFAAGARNKLHTHTTEQIPIITEGKGIGAAKDQEHTVTPRNIVFCISR